MSFDVNWPFDTDGVTGLGFSARSTCEGREVPQEQKRRMRFSGDTSAKLPKAVIQAADINARTATSSEQRSRRISILRISILKHGSPPWRFAALVRPPG
jgi:hypothetical protein